jgi:hypothetical protein
LIDNELLVTKPNYRVVHLKIYIADNKKGKPYQFFCKKDNLSIKNSKPICLYNNKWHMLLTSKKKKTSVGPLGGPPGGPSEGPLENAAALAKWEQNFVIRPMGQMPPIFDGDKTEAKSFIDLLNAYFQLNH